MGRFTQMLDRIFGNHQNDTQKNSLKARSPQLEPLEDRMLLSVAPSDLSQAAIYSTLAEDLVENTPVEIPVSTEVANDLAPVSNPMQDPVKYIDADGKVQTLTEAYTVVTDQMTSTWTAGWYVAEGNVTMTNANVVVNGAVHLILKDGCTLSITGANQCAGIRVSSVTSKLTIYGQTAGTGTLNATGGSLSAGIGGDNSSGAGHDITINGGTVNATGNSAGAGIGGGLGGEGYNITINGGIVNARGANAGAGIGGGSMGKGYDITIKGGMVTAVGGSSGSGIGSGYSAQQPSNIFFDAKCIVKAGSHAGNATVVEHTSTDDLALTLKGKAYVKSEVVYKVTTQEELTTALSNVKAGDTIQLAANIDLTATMNVTAEMNITLDLAGHTLNGSGITDANKASVITNAGTLTIIDSSKTEGNEGTGKITGGKGTKVGTVVGGGGIYNSGKLTFNSGIITENGTKKGGGIYNTGTVTMNGGTITKNTGTSTGGGIHNETGVLTINGGTISENSASLSGGVYNKNGTLTITGGTISGNSSSNGNCGGINNTSGGALIITGGTISGNIAADIGGGIYNSGALTITGGTISGNSAANNGGGIYSEVSPTVGGKTVIENNTAGGNASNLCLQSGKTVTLSAETPLVEGASIGVTLKTGTGTFATGATENDLAFFTTDDSRCYTDYDSESDSLVLKHNAVTLTVTSNKDSGEGTLREALTNARTGDTIEFDLPEDKKTIELESALPTVYCGITIEGDGVILDGGKTREKNFTMLSTSNLTGTLAINNVTFTNSGKGALTCNTSTVEVVLTNCNFQNNENGNWGGAIYCNNANVTVNNGLFVGNYSPTYGGGAVYVSAKNTNDITEVVLNNCTLTGNSTSTGQSGSAVYATANNGKYAVELHNCIVVDNTGSSTEIYGNDTTNSTITCTNVLGTTNNWQGVTTKTGTVLYDNSKPLFKDAEAGDYSIVRDSQAWNAGKNSLVSQDVTKDLAGNDRIVGIVDLGAYEVAPQTVKVIDEQTLNDAMKSVKAGDIIQLDADITLNNKMDVTAAMNFTLDLNGHILKANASESNKFSVIKNGGILTITDSAPDAAHTGDYASLPKGGNITGGYSANGGGIYNNTGATLTINGGTITGNSVSNGGGIYNYHGTLTINGGTITENNATTYGGGIHSSGSLTINGGTISGNSAPTGGGIYNSKDGVLTITGGTITGNSADTGGGIHNGNGGTLTITGGAITGNSAAKGGGVYLFSGPCSVGGTAKILGNTKTDNVTASNLFIRTFVGTINLDTTTPLEEGAEIGITKEAATGVFAQNAAATDAAYFTADDSRVEVEFDSDTNSLKLAHEATTLTVTSNEDSGEGSLREVLANALDGDTIEFDLPEGQNTILLKSALPTISYGITIEGGGVILDGGHTEAAEGYNIFFISKLPETGTFTINNVTFTNAGAIALHLKSNKGETVLTNCKFLNNFNGTYGAAIYCIDSRLTVNNGLFVGNTASTAGGAIGVSATSNSYTTAVVLNNCTLTKNSAETRGDAIVASGDQNCPYTVELNNCIVVNNTGSSTEICGIDTTNCTITCTNALGTEANWQGVTTAEGTVLYDNLKPLFKDAANDDYSLVKDSQAVDVGKNSIVPETLTTDIDGNDRIYNGTVDIGCYEYSAITVTSAADDGSEGTLRWALEQDNDTIVFDKSLNGKTIKLDSTLTISKAVSIDASALDKGITFDGQNAYRIMNIDQVTDASGVKINNVKFINANVNDHGGALLIYGVETMRVSSVVLTNCVFQNNTSTCSGFGLDYAAYGGAVCSVYCNALEFNNCLFTGNSALGSQDGKGGAVYFTYGDLVFNNCTLTKNSVRGASWNFPFAAGSAIFANNEASNVTRVTLNNTIIVGNTGCSTEFYQASTYAYFTCNNVLGTKANWSIDCKEVEDHYTENNFIEYDAEENPDGLFVDADNEDVTKRDYHLVKTSQAYNAGGNSFYTGKADLDGYKRVMYDTIDLGAYEYQYTITPYTDVFDGAEHNGVTIAEPLESGEKVSYIRDGASTQDVPIFRSAGEYVITVCIEREGYKTYNKTVRCEIERATVTISNVDAEDKDYNAKTEATVIYAVDGILPDTNAKLDYTANFENKNAGDNKTVDITFKVTKKQEEVLVDDSSNYKIVVDGKEYTLPKKNEPWIVTTTDTANIRTKNLTVVGTTVSSKTYDGNATATVVAGNLDGIQKDEGENEDKVEIDTATGTFDDGKNAGENKAVTVVYTLKGDDAANYTVSDTKDVATINPRELTVDGTIVDSKYYDGTTDATVHCGALNRSNLVSGDDARITSCTGTFDNQWLGIDKPVTIEYTLDNDNYYVANESQKANITLSLEVTTLEDTVDPDDNVISLREAITYANDIWKQYTQESWSLPEEANEITFADTLEGTITLTDDLTAITAPYDIDGDKRITISGDGKYSLINVAGDSGSGIGKVGSADNPVTITGLTLTGGKADNGAAIQASYSYVTVRDSIITGNTASANGGGIYTFSSTIAVTNSTLTGNTANYGGAIYFATDSTATLVNNTIVGNEANETEGAALYAVSEVKTTTYNNLIVTNGTQSNKQLSGVTLTTGGCDYPTLAASTVFKNALPTTTAGYLTWIPVLKAHKSVVNVGSMSDTVKDAFGVDKTQTDPEIAWAGITDNYDNDRVAITSKPETTKIDVGSYESCMLETPENLATTTEDRTITVTWSAVTDATDYTLEYKKYTDGESGWNVVKEIEETTYTIRDLEYGMKYNIRVKAVDSTESMLDSEYATIDEITEMGPLNLADYSGKNFTLDTYEDAAQDLHLVLYGENDQKLWESITEYGANLKINGDRTVRNMTLRNHVMEDLGTITYNATRDQLFVEGSNGVDTYIIDRETKVEEKNEGNPYKTVTRRVTTNYSTVKFDSGANSIHTGAKLMLNGVAQVNIDAKGEDDTFSVNQLGTVFALTGGDGEDTLDFSEASRQVNLNMGSKYKQSAISGQTGSLLLGRHDIERVFGTHYKDTITSADYITYIHGNGGSDNITLVGDKGTYTTVVLEGKSQIVNARGKGSYVIDLVGTSSTINATSVSSEGHIEVHAQGDRITVNGTAGSDIIEITGDKASVRGNNGDDRIQVIGSNASIYGGNGNDTIIVAKAEGFSSGGNMVNGEGGDDYINLKQTDGKNTINAGAGNDIIIGGSGVDTIMGQSGNNVLIGYNGADSITGGSGRDLLIANTTKQMEIELQTKEEEAFYRELAALWAQTDSVDQIAQLIGKESTADGNRDRLSRGGGKNNIFYYNGETDGDTATSSKTDTLFNDEKDPLDP